MVLHRFHVEQNVKPENTQRKAPIAARRRKSQVGMTLVELMIAMSILAVGLGGIVNVLVVAMETDNRNSKDTSATLLAQLVLEQISAQHPNLSTTIPVTDCQGNVWNIATAGAASPGAGANLVTTTTASGYGGID